MSSINDFATSGAWNYKDIIVPAVVSIPLAIEGATLAKNIYQKPHIVKEKFAALKAKVIESFTVHEGEERNKAILRIAKNCLILVAALGLMATAAYFSAILLPGTLAITTAISSVFLIGKLFVNFNTYKKQLIEAFTVKEGEDPAEAAKRIKKNKLKALALAAFTIATIVIGAYVLMPMMTNGFSFAVSLPLQTKGVVFAEYAAVGVLHGALAYRQWKKGNKAAAIFHLFAAALSFIFPAYYWNNEMRLHHSFYGLLLMAAPSRSLKFFGSLVCFDSALYFLSAFRGYVVSIPYWGDKVYQYDFINSVVDNFPLFAGTYAGANILQNINSAFDEKKPVPKTGFPDRPYRKKPRPKLVPVETHTPQEKRKETTQLKTPEKITIPTNPPLLKSAWNWFSSGYSALATA